MVCPTGLQAFHSVDINPMIALHRFGHRIALRNTMERKHLSSWLKACLLGVLGLCIAAAGCGSDKSGDKTATKEPQTTAVVGVVEQKTVPLTTELTARMKGSETVELRARVEGYLMEAPFEEGRGVSKGQVVFRIDPRTYQARVQSAKAKLAKAQANLRLAKDNVRIKNAEAQLSQAKTRMQKSQTDVNRLAPLAKEMAVPQQDLDDATASLAVSQSDVEAKVANLDDVKLSFSANIEDAEAAVLAADAEVKQAELDLGYCEIRSPIGGVIGMKQVDIGNLVGRGEPTLLGTVSTVNPIRATFSITEREYMRLSRRVNLKGSGKGAPLTLTLADNREFPHKGHLVSAERAVDEKTGTLLILGEFPNPDGTVRPGQFARIKVATDQMEGAILVPQKAVFPLQSTQVVYVVGTDNKVVIRSLQIAGRYEDKFIVQEGLKPGERVVVEGVKKIRPGQTVTPVDAPITAEKGN
jgi:membrane fusion protein (multidrug efflux system)